MTGDEHDGEGGSGDDAVGGDCHVHGADDGDVERYVDPCVDPREPYELGDDGWREDPTAAPPASRGAREAYRTEPMPPREEAVAAAPVEVPFEALSPAALAGVIDAFVLREGTDYGLTEVSHEAKAAQVRRQLERGEARIVFDASIGSVTLLTLAEWKRLAAALPSDELLLRRVEAEPSPSDD